MVKIQGYLRNYPFGKRFSVKNLMVTKLEKQSFIFLLFWTKIFSHFKTVKMKRNNEKNILSVGFESGGRLEKINEK